MPRREAFQSGQASVEFAVVTVLVGLALFAPWFGDRSAAAIVIQTFTELGDSLRLWWAWI